MARGCRSRVARFGDMSCSPAAADGFSDGTRQSAVGVTEFRDADPVVDRDLRAGVRVDDLRHGSGLGTWT
ncbi:MAG: hypothetical protein IH897_08790 [Planctomycetes bacterium]|nr:hypothetical protein [Planctomycetota bacterium]